MESDKRESFPRSDLSNPDDIPPIILREGSYQEEQNVANFKFELEEMKEKFKKLESTMGVDKVTIKEIGEKVVVVVETLGGTAIVPVPPSSGLSIQPTENFGLKSPSGGKNSIPGVVSLQQPSGNKGAPPGGMTAEQLQDFKKMTLQINAMQQKIKDLENKLSETLSGIKKGTERADEMEEKGNETIKDIYKCIDLINNSLSEKIAQQKVEVQKIAGDTPKPINYDPFNYGEAYGGDIVDFQARRRIIEIKLLLQGLQASMNQLRDSVRVSPSIDLGYKVVRLDQLIASSGFGKAIQKGEATHEDALLVSNSKTREPGKVDYPKKEIFQVTDDMESSWAITDSIMQTMFRLEMELGELQKAVGQSDLSGNTKILEDLQSSIKQVRDKATDIKTVKRIVEDALMNKAHNQLSVFEKKSQIIDSSGSTAVLASVSKAKFEQQIKSLSSTLNTVDQRLAKIESHLEKRPNSAAIKGNVETACLACDREIELPNTPLVSSLPNPGSFNPTLPRDPKMYQTPTKLRYVLNRSYDVETSRDKHDVYSMPRPVGAGYAQFWPMIGSSQNKARSPSLDDRRIIISDSIFIQGYDGKLYKADKNNLKIPEVSLN
ncbi:uncharacterized protein LOC106051385 isoform X1 [Biomphalaria glabrata]|uniref:Uncharacterized protein LOC106051385 isoform X1 n=1 Tax=Biomphalaria glabrata TaxID=6526 RepID=A0A9W2Z2M8_BIOGL|nr:uncharacterized protein LOC106051385 isoform X1 [Biomphalaria glabrata]XP_055869203.1 uncharacterized protein LOC106051385 isoform X1 [Biomphalaria glabrata]